MSWRECNPMNERLKFIARLLIGEKMAVLCRELGIFRRPATGPLRATTIAAWKGSPIARAGPTAMPTNCHFRSRRGSRG